MLFKTRGKLWHSQMLPKLCGHRNPELDTGHSFCSTRVSFVADLIFGLFKWTGTVINHEQPLCDGYPVHSRVWLSTVHCQLVSESQSAGRICDFSEGEVGIICLPWHQSWEFGEATWMLKNNSTWVSAALCTNLMNLTARPRSAMQQVPFFFTRMFLLFKSRWAMAGLPWVLKISVCRWHRPLTDE